MPSGLILVVDDYADSREMLTVALEGAGYGVLTADNGWRAISEARRYLPAAIVMDLFMPEMDGLEATRHLKSYPDTRGIPIVAYTARASADGLELFDRVCLKPCPPDRLVGLVGDVIGVTYTPSARLHGARAGAVALRERALTLCRAFTKSSMKAVLGQLVLALEERIARLDELRGGGPAIEALIDSSTAFESRIAELEELLRVSGPDVEGGTERAAC